MIAEITYRSISTQIAALNAEYEKEAEPPMLGNNLLNCRREFIKTRKVKIEQEELAD